MKQIHFTYKDADDLKRRIIDVKKQCEQIERPQVLFRIYSDETDMVFIRLICDVLDKEMPEAMYMGCTTGGNIINGGYDSSTIAIVCTIYEGKDTKITLFQHELIGEDVSVVNKSVYREVESIEDAVSVEIILSAKCMSTKGFCKDYGSLFSGLMVYGGGAINKQMDPTDSFVFSKGNKITDKGFIMLVTSGTDIHIETMSIVGWKPLGKIFDITKAEKNRIIELNNEPAFNAYSRYLNIKNDEYFSKNTPEFPLLCSEGTSEPILKATFSALEDGSILMFSDVEEYTKAQLTYGDHDTILEAVSDAAFKLAEGNYEVIEIFSCCARKAFWGDQISVESFPFQKVAPTSGFFTSGEILNNRSKINIHNETMVIAAMKEGAGVPNVASRIKKPRENEVLSLTRRLMNFVGVATNELNENNARLDDLVKEIESRRIEADRANMAKSDFLANMSHEIRTPINAILGFDTMILRENKDKNIRGYAYDIKESGENLLSIINEILDLSKIESGKMDILPQKYQLNVLIQDVVKMVNLKAEEKGLEVKLDIDRELPSVLYGDDLRIKQIIINLMNNAVKYTNKGSVTLRMSGKPDGYGIKLKVEVIDTGVGIKKEDMNKLFEKFKRIEENKNRNVEGSGLGMNITAKLLALMETGLMVESEYGKGSTFFFELDQIVVEETPVGEIILENYDSKDPDEEYVASFWAPDAHILVVDDNAINRKVFINLLKTTGVQVDEAEGGLKSLELTSQKKYDIIFMDHMMPDLDGVETFKRMKASDTDLNKETPMVVLTANALSGAREEYIKLGFDEFISKPFVPSEVEAMIGDFLPKEKKQTVMVEKPQETKEPQEITLPTVNGLDYTYAMTHLESQDMLRDTINLFIANADNDASELIKLFDELRKNPTEEAFSAYRVKVHSMKSSSAYIGAMSVSGMARFLEFSAKDKRIKDIELVTVPFLGEWKRLLGMIKDVFEVKATKTEKEFNKEDISILISSLKDSYFDEDERLLEAFIIKTDKYNMPEDISKMYTELKAAIKKKNSEEVSSLSDSIIEKLK